MMLTSEEYNELMEDREKMEEFYSAYEEEEKNYYIWTEVPEDADERTKEASIKHLIRLTSRAVDGGLFRVEPDFYIDEEEGERRFVVQGLRNPDADPDEVL